MGLTYRMKITVAKKQEFLSEYELEVFKLVNEGKTAQEIAEEINNQENFRYQKKKDGTETEVIRKPENIRKTKVVVRNKIEKELERIAATNRLDLDLANMPKDAGLMIAFDWVHNTKVYLFFTSAEGIIAWWEHECSDRCEPRCKNTLGLILKERKIELPSELKNESILEKFRYVVSVIQEIGEK